MKDASFKLDDYKLYKHQLIKIYEKLGELQNEFTQNLRYLWDYVQSRIESLKKSEIIIAVAGEVKAGKSTFINALLKEELLPSDVLQATSAIIEIFYSQKPLLKITYLSGKVVSYEEESKLMFKDLLKKVASIPDEFRDVPTSLIDQYMIDFKEKPEITDEFIKYLEEKSGMDNLIIKKQKILEYTQQLSPDNIPMRIELGYPFPWKIEDLRIVDMPGVNAIGGVQDISFSFIERAHAILFIHPIKPVESESFKRFVQSIISDKSKDYLFLVLTHAAVFHEERERLLDEARRIYGPIISEERIFAVDSILKLIYEDLSKGKTPTEIKSNPSKRKWYILYKEIAEEEGQDLGHFLLRESGFMEFSKKLEEFIVKIPFQEIKNILDKMREIYEDLLENLEENVEMLQSQKRDPVEFLKEIEIKQKGIERLETQCYLILEEAYINFRGTNSSMEHDINELKLKYYDLFSNATSLEEVRKYYRDAENELVKIVAENQKAVNLFFRDKLNTIGENLVEEYRVKIPKIDLTTIEEVSKQRATKTETVYREEIESLFENWNYLKPWRWLKSSRTYKVAVGNRVIFDEKAFFNNLKNTLVQDFVSTVEKLREEFYSALSFYRNKISDMLKERKTKLENLKRDLKSIEKIEQEILSYKKKITLMEGELRKIKVLIEEIDGKL